MDVSVVVSNTTSLIALAWLERLDLLPTLFGRVHIPQAVHDEIHHYPEAIGVSELGTAPWLVVTLMSDVLRRVGE